MYNLKLASENENQTLNNSVTIDNFANKIDNDIAITSFNGVWMFSPNCHTTIDFVMNVFKNMIDEDDDDFILPSFDESFDFVNTCKFISSIMWDGVNSSMWILPMQYMTIFKHIDSFSESNFLLRILLLSGDVEMNPGPVQNVELKLRKRIEALERSRERQVQKNKTLVKKLRQSNKQNKFKFQMDNLVTAARDISKSLNTPATYRMAGYAAANFILPGSGSSAAMTVEGSKILNKINSVSESVSNLARDCANEIPKAFAKHSVLTDTATIALEAINKVTEKITCDDGILSKLENFIGGVTSGVSSTSLLISILVILICISMDVKISCSIIVMVLIYFKWPQSVMEKVKQILYGFKWQMDIDTNAFSMVGQILFTLLAFFGVSKIPSERFYDNIIKRLDSVPKAFSGTAKIWDAAGKTFDFVRDEFKCFFLGTTREELYHEYGIAGEIAHWVERVKFYTSAEMKNKLAKDDASVQEVEQLYTQMYRWKHTTSVWKSLHIDCQRILSSLTPVVNDLYKFACRSTVHEGGPRNKPLGVLISGDSGSGKTELLVPLYTTLLAHRNQLYCKNINNEVYIRNYETEYWDGYVGQKVCIFDDAFQMKDTPGNPSPEFMESIRLLNSAPAHVHCADLNDKGRFFSSEICIYTTNLNREFSKFITSVNCPEAAIRRLNMCAYRIRVAAGYGKEVTVNGTKHTRLDIKKIRDCEKCLEFKKINNIQSLAFCAHAQEFEPYDMFTDQQIGDVLSYGELVVHLKREDDKSQLAEGGRRELSDLLAANPNIFDFKPQNADDIYEDAVETFGAIDLNVPTDIVAYQTLVTYLLHLNDTNPNEDQILADLALHPQLFSTYQRRLHYGIRNVNSSNNSLILALEAAGIHYNYDNDVWYTQRNMRQHFNTVMITFNNYVSQLHNKISQIWNGCSIGEICGFISLAIGIFGLIGFVYTSFSKDKIEDFKSENSSAPVQPKTQNTFVVENSSAPLQPKTQNTFKVENSSAPLQPRTIASFKTEVYQDRGCQMLESAIVRKSLYALHSETTVFGNVIFIRGTTFLMNYHFIEMLRLRKDPKMKLFCTNAARVQIEFDLNYLLNNFVRLTKSGRETDSVLVSLDPVRNKVHIHPDITKHFIRMEDLSLLSGVYNAQLPSYAGRNIDFLYPNLRSITDVQMSNNEYRISDAGFQFIVNQSWSYFGSTTDGDCGGPVILNNDYASHKIVGIHMAARQQGNGSQGLAQTITQEMLNEAFKMLPHKYQCYSEIDIPMTEIDMDASIQGSVPLDAGLMVHGVTDKMSKSGDKTKIMPSVLYDIREPKTKPAQLRANSEHNPMYKGLLKFGKNVPKLNYDMVEACINDVSNNMFINNSHRILTDYQRVLTYREALCGVENDEFLAPINRTTSMGYPYTVDYVNLRGKRDAFGDDEWTFDTPLALEVERRVNTLKLDCLAGIQRGVYWSDTLKDERRPIEKVNAGKTRVFCGGPVHFTLLFRQYFLGFAAWIMHNRNANEVATGTNVYSHDWNEIVSKLASRGSILCNHKMMLRVIAGDFGNFDGSLNSQILWAILDLINDWYDDGEENARVRYGLWLHIVHAIHINGNVIYQSTHSQPSGCPITAILNSIYNSIIVRMVYLTCAVWRRSSTGEDYVSMKKFNEFVAMVSYGDDNLIAVSDSILEWFNQVVVTEAFTLLGHEYTDESKSGRIVPIRDISEVAFLKRKFVWDDSANRYVAPLDLDTIMEIVQWTKRGLSADAITLANIDVTMRELSLHTREIFDENSKLIRDACRSVGISYKFLSYYEYRDNVLAIPFLAEMNSGETYTIKYDPKIYIKNYIYMDHKRKILRIGEHDSDIMKHKIKLFCSYRNIDVVAATKATEHLLF